MKNNTNEHVGWNKDYISQIKSGEVSKEQFLKDHTHRPNAEAEYADLAGVSLEKKSDAKGTKDTKAKIEAE